MSVPVSTSYFDASSPATNYLTSTFRNNFKMRFFFLARFPSAAWWGFKVLSCTHLRSEVSLPYGWRTKNPFQSIYFAALAGAGEFATGILGIIAMQNRKDISMLVVRQEAEFIKKVNTKITFTCDQGQEVIDTVQKAMDTGEAYHITMEAIGRNATGDMVCKVRITWSFKKRIG